MENLKAYLEKTKGVKYSTTNGKINQKQARILKASIESAILKDLESMGFDVGKVDKGVVVNVPNTELGSFTINFNAIIKSLDYDFEGSIANYEKKTIERNKKLAE